MTTSYRHRRNRPFHLWRHGWAHRRLHKSGIRHRHGRHSRHEKEQIKVARWRLAPRRLWPKEFARQLLAGAAIGVGVVLVVFAVMAVFAFLGARNDLSKAQQIAKSIIHDRHELLSPAGRSLVSDEISQMKYYAALADDRLSGSPAVSIMKLVPFVGPQVSALANEVSGVDTLAGQGQTLLQVSIATIRASHGTSISLPKLKLLDNQVHRSDRILRALETSPSGLWGPARTERIKFNSVLSTVVDLLHRGGEALDFAQPFLGSDGPRTYLVAGQNNSEMRDQGAVLSWALLTVRNGTFTMSHAASVGTISLSHPAASIGTGSTAAAFGAFDPTRIWQSVNANGSFPVSARWMIAMFHQARGITVNGVVGVDVRTLANILHVAGAVRVPDIHGSVGGNNVASLLLYDLYKKYPEGSQKARHDDITEVAQAAVKKMGHVHYDLGAFLQALATSSQGRHLLFYDTNPRLERVVTSFGGSGSMQAQGRNDIHLAIEAGVAAKLDWFLHTSVTYQVKLSASGVAQITTTLLMHNNAPAGVPGTYALGPDNTNSHVEGEYIARVFEWMPPGYTAPGYLKNEEGLNLLRAIQPVYAQQTQEVVFTALCPHALRHGVLTLHFVPQGLIHPSSVTVTFTGNGNFSGPTQTSWSNGKAVTLSWRSSQ